MSANAERIIARNNALKNDASNFRLTWQDVANYIIPRKGQITETKSPGTDQTTQLLDTTAGESLLVFAAGILSQMMPLGEIWARFEPSDKKASPAIGAFFDQATERVLDAIHNSNFYLAIHEDLLDAGAFCTSALYVEEGKRSFLNFANWPVGSFVIAEDNEGMVDTVFKEWQWSARQAEQQWGRSGIASCKKLMEALTSTKPEDGEKKFTFVHAIYPRPVDEVREGKVSGKFRPIASVSVCVEDKEVVNEDGYYEMPAAVSRLMRSNNEVYGRGPGTEIMPEVKLAQRVRYDYLLALEKAVNPGWIAPEDAAYRPDNRPGGVTYWDATNPNNKPEREKVEARLDWAQTELTEIRERIRRAFFVDMFQMLNRPEVLKNERTAYQIAEMLKEKLLLFSPIFARITLEKLNTTLERVFNMMLRAGELGEVPAELQGGSYKITYTSKIALAIKAAQDNATVEMLQLCSLMQPFDQSVSMVVKWRDRFRAACRNSGLPSLDLRTDEEIDAMLASIQQAQDAMQKAEAAKNASESVRNLGPEAQKIATNAVAQFAA